MTYTGILYNTGYWHEGQWVNEQSNVLGTHYFYDMIAEPMASELTKYPRWTFTCQSKYLTSTNQANCWSV